MGKATLLNVITTSDNTVILEIKEMDIFVEGVVDREKLTFKTEEVTVKVTPIESMIYGFYNVVANKIYKLYLAGKITDKSVFYDLDSKIRG